MSFIVLEFALICASIFVTADTFPMSLILAERASIFKLSSLVGAVSISQSFVPQTVISLCWSLFCSKFAEAFKQIVFEETLIQVAVRECKVAVSLCFAAAPITFVASAIEEPEHAVAMPKLRALKDGASVPTFILEKQVYDVFYWLLILYGLFVVLLDYRGKRLVGGKGHTFLLVQKFNLLVLVLLIRFFGLLFHQLFWCFYQRNVQAHMTVRRSLVFQVRG